MKFLYFFFIVCLCNLKCYAQSKPKIVVTLVVDQMRWEYLTKFSNNYSKYGFSKLLKYGYSCQNTHLNYYPSYDAPGYASIFTGTVPSIHGITANSWYDPNIKKVVYCVDDSTVKAIGSNSKASFSPENLQASTIGDELRLFSNMKSRVYSISLSNRAAILSGGFSANAAFWYDEKTGKFISSSYYINELPDWVDQFNNDSIVDKMYYTDWNLLLPKEKYVNTYREMQTHVDNPFAPQGSLPYSLAKYSKSDYSKILRTPYGNTLVFEFAKRLINSEKLGLGANTDLLSISLTATDNIGHAFGPSSIELEDTYLRLDCDISCFLNYLDTKYGEDNYLFVLTSDHGVANNSSYLKEARMKADYILISQQIKDLELKLKSEFGDYNWIKIYNSPMIFLNETSLIESRVDKSLIINRIQKYLESYNPILKVLDLNNITNNLLESGIRNKITNGVYSKLAGDLLILLKPNYYDYLPTGTTHGSLYSYDTHIPLIWFGDGIKRQKDFSPINIIDIAPTLCAILEIQEPNACTGNIIQQLITNLNK